MSDDERDTPPAFGHNFVSTNPNGNYLQQASSYIPFALREFSSYLPNSIATKLGLHASGSGVGGSSNSYKRKVLWKSFEKYINPHSYPHAPSLLFLVLGLADGFQVYQIVSTDDLRLVASNSEGPISRLKIIPETLSDSNLTTTTTTTHNNNNNNNNTSSNYSNTSNSNDIQSSELQPSPDLTDYSPPLFLITSGDDRPSFPQNRVHIYSAGSRKYVHVLRFRDKIHGGGQRQRRRSHRWRVALQSWREGW